MRIKSVRSWVEDFGLVRPYTIAFQTVTAVQNAIVELESDTGLVGLGAASPEPFVTGESAEDCRQALQADALNWIEGREISALAPLCRELDRRMPATPAARAAVDIAVHDLFAQSLGQPLVDILGRVHQGLPTSITIGIKPLDETLAEAEEYLGRGFRVLKVKTGQSLEEDLERLRRLREHVGPHIGIRVDPNQGYSANGVLRFVEATEDLDIEFLEQPMAAEKIAAMRGLPDSVRKRIAADESLRGESDAIALAGETPACGIFNIKLMKCGGVWSAGRIATIAEAAGLELMWGCMDESAISISAALHAALASPATRYLDLDGSLDLARDLVEGGFIIDNGIMRTRQLPGLGLTRMA
jgi:L-alanine-DL-glutamate epimerase-like enolase superfamily enzyme